MFCMSLSTHLRTLDPYAFPVLSRWLAVGTMLGRPQAVVGLAANIMAVMYSIICIALPLVGLLRPTSPGCPVHCQLSWLQIETASLDRRSGYRGLLPAGLVREVNDLLQHQLPGLGAKLINIGGGHARRLDGLENYGTNQPGP